MSQWTARVPLAIAPHVTDVENRGDEMSDLRLVSSRQVGQPAGAMTLRCLYDAAMREVRADPVGTLAKYQPTWLFPARSGRVLRAMALSAANADRY